MQHFLILNTRHDPKVRNAAHKNTEEEKLLKIDEPLAYLSSSVSTTTHISRPCYLQA